MTCQPSSYIYGISNTRVIYETDVNTQKNRAVFNADPLLPAGNPNAFAYDTARNDFFFLDSTRRLWYWDRVSPTITRLTSATSDIGLSGFAQPANAVYYQNAYWFVRETEQAVTSQTLIKVELAYGSGSPVVTGFKTYTYNIVNSNNQPISVSGFSLFSDTERERKREMEREKERDGERERVERRRERREKENA